MFVVLMIHNKRITLSNTEKIYVPELKITGQNGKITDESEEVTLLKIPEFCCITVNSDLKKWVYVQ